jgi:hypothetical protein
MSPDRGVEKCLPGTIQFKVNGPNLQRNGIIAKEDWPHIPRQGRNDESFQRIFVRLSKSMKGMKTVMARITSMQ